MQTSIHASMQSWCEIRLDIGLFFIVPLETQGTLKRFEYQPNTEKIRY